MPRQPARIAKPPLRHRLREPLAAFLLAAFSRLSLCTAHRLGRLIGSLAFYLPTRARKISLTNIAIYAGIYSGVNQKRLAKQSLQHTACAFTELGALWLWPEQAIYSMIKSVEGEQHVKAALENAKGVIFITPHIGSWEMIGLYVARNFNLTTMYKPHRIAAVSDVMKHGRERFGGTYVPANSQGLAQLLKALRAGNSIGLLPDQDPGYESGVFAPLLGIETNTVTLIAKLAAKSGAPLLACYSERMLNGEGYKVIFRPAITLPNDIHAATCEMNKEDEQVIHACPQQYLWSYPRFKRRPNPDEDFYS